MKTRDVMTSNVVAVHADTTVKDIARLLLETQVSGVPVLDRAGAPLGMVSEADLLGREEADPPARGRWWLRLLAEGEPLSAEFCSALGARRERTASEVMSKPVIAISEDADAAEIAVLLRAQRVRRATVVRDGKVVGIVSRGDLLRALAKQEAQGGARSKSRLLAAISALFERPRDPAPPPAPPSDDAPIADDVPVSDDAPITVADFRRLVNDFQEHEAEHRRELRRDKAAQDRRKATELIDQHISDEQWRDLVHRARDAAERGKKEFMLVRFPSALCRDGGRAVNAPEPDWPASLRGLAADVYQRWERDLKPQGFHIAARVVSFLDGIPGDIGLFLVWRD